MRIKSYLYKYNIAIRLKKKGEENDTYKMLFL